LPCQFATCSAISGTSARSLLLLLGLRHVLFTLVYLISWRKSCMALAGLLLAVAADATLLYSWPYGLPAATAQASYGTSTRNNMFAAGRERVCRIADSRESAAANYTAVIPEIAGTHRLLRVAACGLVGYHVACLLCSDVMFQICVCDIMRYFTILIVYCF